MKSFIIGAILAAQLLYRASADCNAIYFNFDDDVRRPVYPIGECAMFTSGGIEYSYQYERVSTSPWSYRAIKAKYVLSAGPI